MESCSSLITEWRTIFRARLLARPPTIKPARPKYIYKTRRPRTDRATPYCFEIQAELVLRRILIFKSKHARYSPAMAPDLALPVSSDSPSQSAVETASVCLISRIAMSTSTRAYPMTASNYAAKRSALAKSAGLGRRPAPAIEVAPAKRPGRPKKSAA
jgi:hypothetical protein